MAAIPKAKAKAAAAVVRKRDFLLSLSETCMASMVVKIEGNDVLARDIHADGLIHFGQDTTTITAEGREWLRENG